MGSVDRKQAIAEIKRGVEERKLRERETFPGSIRIESENGVRIHPDCELMVDGELVSGFKVSLVSIEYGASGSGPKDWEGRYVGRPPHPIMRIVVESKGYKASEEEKIGEVHE